MKYMGEAGFEILAKCRMRAKGDPDPQLTERAKDWLDAVRVDRPEVADLLTEYALGRVDTKEKLEAMYNRLKELDGGV